MEPLLIRCTGHEFTETGSKRVLYLIDVTLGVHTITIKKRCRDFHKLHGQLCSQFSKDALPTLPQRTLFRSFKPEYVQEKTLALGAYVTRLKENIEVLSSTCFQEFMGDANLLVLLDQQQRQQQQQRRQQQEQEGEEEEEEKQLHIRIEDKVDDEDTDGNTIREEPEDLESPKLWTEERPSQLAENGNHDSMSELTRATISDTVIRTLPKKASVGIDHVDEEFLSQPCGVTANAAATAAITAAEAAAAADYEWSPASQFAAAEAAKEASRARCLILSERLHRAQETILEERQAAARYKGERDKTAAEMHLLNVHRPEEEQAHAAEVRALEERVHALEMQLKTETLQRLDQLDQLKVSQQDNERLFQQLQQERQQRLQANEALRRQQEQCARLRREKKVLVAALKEGRRQDMEQAEAQVLAHTHTAKNASGNSESSSKSSKSSSSSSSSSSRNDTNGDVSKVPKKLSKLLARSVASPSTNGTIINNKSNNNSRTDHNDEFEFHKTLSDEDFSQNGSAPSSPERGGLASHLALGMAEAKSTKQVGDEIDVDRTALLQGDFNDSPTRWLEHKQPGYLRIVVLRAQKLVPFSASQLKKKLDKKVVCPYVKASLLPGDSSACTSCVVEGGVNPVFDRTKHDSDLRLEVHMSYSSFVAAIREEVAWLTLEVFNNKNSLQDDLLGTVRLVPEEMLSILESTAAESVKCKNFGQSDNGKNQGNDNLRYGEMNGISSKRNIKSPSIEEKAATPPRWYPLDTGGQLHCTIQFCV